MKPNRKLARSMRVVANELAELDNSGELETAERVIAERITSDLRWLANRLQERWRG